MEKGSKKSRDVTFVLYGGVHVPLIKLGKYKCTASIPEVSSAAVIRYAM